VKVENNIPNSDGISGMTAASSWLTWVDYPGGYLSILKRELIRKAVTQGSELVLKWWVMSAFSRSRSFRLGLAAAEFSAACDEMC
jgi:hypothetical protein